MHRFNERLSALREKYDLTTSQMAKIAKVTTRMIQLYEQKNYSPNAEVLIKIAEYFNVSIDYLVGRTDNPEVNK